VFLAGTRGGHARAVKVVGILAGVASRTLEESESRRRRQRPVCKPSSGPRRHREIDARKRVNRSFTRTVHARDIVQLDERAAPHGKFNPGFGLRGDCQRQHPPVRQPLRRLFPVRLSSSMTIDTYGLG
jgi:hypothetical protein